jgi:hypothetical protein
MRYDVLLKDTLGETFTLGGNSLPAARTLAEGMTHPDDKYPFWEIVDSYSGNVVMSSDSSNDRRSRNRKQ